MKKTIAVGFLFLGLLFVTTICLGQSYTITDLGTLGGSLSVGNSINASGQVTGGASTSSGNIHAFLYSAGTGMVDLGSGSGEGINASGQVTGSGVFSIGGFASVHAFLYSAGTGMIDLNTVLPSGSGWTLSTATAINDLGQITGSGTNPNGATHAFLLSPTIRRTMSSSF